jgi:hypothetical protein
VPSSVQQQIDEDVETYVIFLGLSSMTGNFGVSTWNII